MPGIGYWAKWLLSDPRGHTEGRVLFRPNAYYSARAIRFEVASPLLSDVGAQATARRLHPGDHDAEIRRLDGVGESRGSSPHFFSVYFFSKKIRTDLFDLERWRR